MVKSTLSVHVALFFFSSHMGIKQYLIKCTMMHFTFIHPNQYRSAVSTSCYKRLQQLTSEPKNCLRLTTSDQTENSSVSYRIMCHDIILQMNKLKSVWTAIMWDASASRKADEVKCSLYFDSHQVASSGSCQKFSPRPEHFQSTGI